MNAARKTVDQSAPKSMTAKSKKAGAVRKDRDVGAIIKNMDVASLHDDDITTVLHHCASAMNLRKVIGQGAKIATASAGYCYTKSGDSSTVSIWSGGFKVGESSEAEAKASGIPPCG
jgi:hypothetical protein